MTARRSERGGDRGSALGSALLLVPAGVLVLFVLGAVALDTALVFLGQRALTDAAAAGADGAAAVALSDAAFYGSAEGRLVLDRAAAEVAADDAVARRGLRGVVLRDRAVVVDGNAVCVRLTGEVRRLFAPVVPGVSRAAVVRGRAVASAVRGEAGTSIQLQHLSC